MDRREAVDREAHHHSRLRYRKTALRLLHWNVTYLVKPLARQSLRNNNSCYTAAFRYLTDGTSEYFRVVCVSQVRGFSWRVPAIIIKTI